MKQLITGFFSSPSYDSKVDQPLKAEKELREWVKKNGWPVKQFNELEWQARVPSRKLMNAVWAGRHCDVGVRNVGGKIRVSYKLPVVGQLMRYFFLPIYFLALGQSAVEGEWLDVALIALVAMVTKPASEYSAFFGQREKLDSLSFTKR